MGVDFGGELRGMMKGGDDSTLWEAIKTLIKKDEDLPLKTEIPDPVRFAALTAIGTDLKLRGMKETSKFIREFQKSYMIYMVSKDRQSRREIIEVLTKEQERMDSLTEKLLSRRE